MKMLLLCGLAGLMVMRASGFVTGTQQADPVFTAAQATAGRTAYRANCAACHAGDLGGNTEAPKLAGEDFVNSWRTRTTLDLFQYVQGMPPDGPRLSADDYLAVVAYILHENGASAGEQALTPTTATPIGSIATGKRPSAPPMDE